MRSPGDFVQVHVIGRACRLPGAPSVDSFWANLDAGHCSISQIGPDRWPIDRYLDPRPGQPGKSYTFAAGVLDDVWGFDPVVFGISPREADQMDPQQRLCLELVWEALEEAGIPPSKLASRPVGVYAGASALDYGTTRMFDAASADAYFMIGNTLSLISNRISHAFDFEGPSLTIDTACSSSLVALHHAVEALESSAIEVAVVLGVNMLLSPFSFIGFSQAHMLAPDGICRPFDAEGKGYVRAEGGVALVLARADASCLDPVRRHCRIVATGVNSDGRTVGVSLPSSEKQARLLEQVYRKAGVDPERLSFVEAHGTGTRVGDPAEAEALGRVLGQRRSQPLPIGSVKSNIGHLEPASGLAGVLKAMLALEKGRLPRSLHFKTPNPDIAFSELNLAVASEPIELQQGRQPRVAGINSFGFGGTNAHAIIAEPDAPARGKGRNRSVVPAEVRRRQGAANPIVVLSATSGPALADLARDYIRLLDGDARADVAALAQNIGHFRDLLPERAALLATNRAELRDDLAALAAEAESPGVVTGRSADAAARAVFVFSGNGSQWAGMGRAALSRNPAFKASLEATDRIFSRLSRWSLVEALGAPDLAERLRSTVTAQPLLLALQIAAVAALKEFGIEPDAVLGHSVGEVAAAYVSGALSLDDAVEIIVARSTCQEPVRNSGAMATLRLGEHDAAEAIAASGLKGIEIAAINSPASVTISGPRPNVESFCRFAESNGLATRLLDLEYPFHCALVDPVRKPLLRALEGLGSRPTRIPFISTVTGRVHPGEELGAPYWWDNVRAPVRFGRAIETAYGLGDRLFIEIGPRPVLQSYMRECLAGDHASCSVMASLSPGDASTDDPIRRTAALAIVSGAEVAKELAFGPRPLVPIRLPTYPWQRVEFRGRGTAEAVSRFGRAEANHPLLGWQSVDGDLCWRNHVDPGLMPWLTDHRVDGHAVYPGLVPWLTDHRVDGHAVYPGAAFVETALAAARLWLGTDRVVIRDMEILQPLIFRDGETSEIRLQLTPETGSIVLASRPRLSDQSYQTHAVCRAAKSPAGTHADAVPVMPASWTGSLSSGDVYAAALKHTNDYGPAFRRVERVMFSDGGSYDLLLAAITDSTPVAGPSSPFAVHPVDLDAAFHGLFLRPGADDGSGRAPLPLVPVRCGELRLYAPGRRARYARVDVRRSSKNSIQVDIALRDEEGALIAQLTDVRLAAATFMQRPVLADLSYHEVLEPIADPNNVATAPSLVGIDQLCAEASELIVQLGEPASEPRLLLEAAAQRVAYDTLIQGAPAGTRISTDGGEPGARVPFDHWREAVLPALEASGLAEKNDEGWTLAPGCELPEVSHLLRTVLAEYPDWVADCVLLQRASSRLAGVAGASGNDEVPAGGWYSAAMLDHFRSSSPRVRKSADIVANLTSWILEHWPEARPIRVCLVGADGSLTRRLCNAVADCGGRIVIADKDKRALDRAHLELSGCPGTSILDLGEAQALSSAGPFDLVVSAFGLTQLDVVNGVQSISGSLASGGMLITAEAQPDTFHDLVFGLDDGWFHPPGHGAVPAGRLRSGTEWAEDLGRAGLVETRVLAIGDSANLLIAKRNEPVAGPNASQPAPRRSVESWLPIAVICSEADREKRISAALVTELARCGRDVTITKLHASSRSNGSRNKSADPAVLGSLDLQSDHDARVSASRHANGPSDSGARREIVYLAGVFGGTPGCSSASLSERLAGLAELISRNGETIERLWILAPGGSGHCQSIVPESTGSTAIWAFGRAAANEYPDLDIRLVDLASGVDDSHLAGRLACAIGDAGPYREIVIGRTRLSALKVRRGPAPVRSAPMPAAAAGGRLVERSVLVQGQTRSLQSLAWHRAPLAPPKAGEVQVEVKAAGLNFRDLMWALGSLPEEALEDGFAGPTLGFECAGRVTEVGAGVDHLAAGDPVIAMAPHAFASHVTVAATAVARLPETMDLEAAATIPVAYLTSCYALEHLAKLSPGEWVLIHGGAGGVGLAAIEIARANGAHVIATAGTEEKREILRLLGATHVLSSRSLDFADEVMRLTGGVDVVLNSLSGEAMELSIGLMKPFGRFLELGKRDFFANTRIGLRPFRRNVSYFGIDADQLLAQQPALAQRLIRELIEKFADGTYHPIPHRCFGSQEVVDAFRLMQQSGHIGKIIVTPPAPQSLPAENSAIRPGVAGRGAHVIVGGLGGFGIETAAWLGDRGARTIVLTGRSGRVAEGGNRIIEDLRRRGIDVRQVACDATDARSLERLLAGLRAEMPIKGIVHAAAVLEDALITNLDEAKLARVLSPKVAAAQHLDRLTRTDKLDYFLLYSSVTALIGNPGQSAYVAANGFLEGVARRRRAEGYPALAIRWGAITDAGMLQRDSRTAATIARRAGVIGLKARQALDLLSEVLAADDGREASAVVTIAPMNWAAARSGLALLRTPLFEDLADTDDAMATAGQAIDLSALIANLDDQGAEDLVCRHLASELATILRMPADGINWQRPLADLGLDSLMAVELRMAASRKLGVEIPLVALADGLSLGGISSHIVRRLKVPSAAGEIKPSLERDLAAIHVADALDGEQLNQLRREIARHEAGKDRVN